MAGSLIYFPKHKRMTWESLGGCSRCLGWEGEMPTDCPGVPMTQEQKDAVLTGPLDYTWKRGWFDTGYRARGER